MKLNSLKSYNNYRNSSAFSPGAAETSFTGFNAHKVLLSAKQLKASSCILDSHYGKIFSEMVSTVGDDVFNGKVIRNLADGSIELVNETFREKFLRSATYPFLKMPLDIIGGISAPLAKKFPKSKILNSINNAEILKKHRADKKTLRYIHSLRGALENVSENAIKKNFSCNTLKPCKNGCSEVVDLTDNLLDKVFNPEFGNFNTPTERSLNRFLTALIPAFFLGTDVYNMSKRNGASDAEANKSAIIRTLQEGARAGSSAYLQYNTLSAFDVLTNTEPMAAPVINAASALTSDISSRLVVGKPLTPQKLTDEELKQKGQNIPLKGINISEFVESAKDADRVKHIFDVKDIDNENEKKTEKRHLITPKTVALYALLSIAGGFAIKSGKKHLSKPVKEFLKKHANNKIVKFGNSIKNKYHKLTVTTLNVQKADLDEYFNRLEKAGQGELASRYKKSIEKVFKSKFSDIQNQTINLGQIKRSITIPVIKQKVAIEDLLKIPMLPLSMLKEFAVFPFEMFQKLLAGLSQVKPLAKLGSGKVGKLLKDWSAKPEKAKVRTTFPRVRNAYIDYMSRSKKLNDAEFSEYIKNAVIRSFDSISSSGVDNKGLAKMTKLLTVIASTYFTVVDDYNLTLHQTKDKEKAAHSGRERFIQKMVRTFTQTSLIDIFNSIFRTQYNNSLVGALTVASVNTVATDCVTRYLSGKPVTRMSKEEQEEFDKKRENGLTGKYFKFIKKLAE